MNRESAKTEDNANSNEDSSHAELLNSIYRLQRHFYDFTRKYYLFGRDRLLNQMLADNPGSILEVGCGTGRNLKILSKLANSDLKLFGLDASTAMLEQAEKNLSNLKNKVPVCFGFAESFSGENLFGQEKFDQVFFSYALSMIPDWQGAINNGLNHLKPHGKMWIVDFWDQGGYPRWFQGLLKRWLALFHVRYEPALPPFLEGLKDQGYRVIFEPVGRRYAYIASIKKIS